MLSLLKRLGLMGTMTPAAERWVVVDVETSGFDPTQDGLISIGAVAMRADGRVLPAESFEIVYRLSKPTTTGTITPDDAAGEIAPRLYPNPAKSADVKLSLGSLAPGRYEVQVLDMSGRSVMTRSIEHLSSTGAYQILKGQKLSTGQYLIRLSLEGKVLETLQFINE